MIQINDNDLPIMVAEKIINGTKPYNPTDLMKADALEREQNFLDAAGYRNSRVEFMIGGRKFMVKEVAQ